MYVMLVLALFIAFVNSCESDKKSLYLLDLYICVDEFQDYCYDIPRLTVRSAIELANSRDDILPDYTLCTVNKLNGVTASILSDGKAVMISAILDNFYKELDTVMSQPNSTVSPIVLGSPFSFVSEYTVDILGTHQNFVQMNHKSTTANLSNSSFFYWIGPNQTFFNAVRLQLLIRNNWRRVGILSSLDGFSSAAEELEKTLRRNDISVINTESFIIKGGLNGNQLNILKEEDVRIIIALVTVIEVPLIMCIAYEVGLIDDRHVWILPQMNLNDIRRVAEQYNMCDIDTVLRNALMVEENYYNSENHSLPFKKTDVDDLLVEYKNLTSATNLAEIPGYYLSKVVFDATWAVILALNNSMQLLAEKGWSLDESVNQNGVDQRILDIIKWSINKVKFSGLSGMVNFGESFAVGNTSKSNSFFKTGVSQIINNSSCTVEIYNDRGVISASDCNYTWENNPPVSDGLIDRPPQVPAALFIFTIVATITFLFVAMALIIFSVSMRNHKYMKTSSVTVNVVIIVGCILLFMIPLPALLTYGSKQYSISEEGSNALCYANFCQDIGIILLSTAVLLKTWKLYRIQTNKLLKKKLGLVSNKAMLIFAVILLFPVALLISIQLIIDRPKLTTELLEIQDGYPYEHVEYTYCDQKLWNLWKILLAMYNIAILVHTFKQAGHVSKMSIERLASEGDISIRLLLATCIIVIPYIFIATTFVVAGNYYVGTVVYILGFMIIPVVIITMTFSPKVYVMIYNHMQVRKLTRKRNSDCGHETDATTL